MVLLYSAQSAAQDHVLNFLNSLNKEQLAKAQLAFDDPLRETWHFFPASMWQREGVSLKELNASQKTLLHTMLKKHLSESGYTKAMKIIALEDVLLEMDSNSTMRDSEKYYVTIYGDPKKDSLWGWSFEGHHLSLNFAITEDKVSFTPRFFGASPAIIKQGKRKGERTLEKEQDLALELINELSASQREIAIFNKTAFDEIVSFVETSVKPMDPVGIALNDLEKNQKKLLLSLIYEYLSAMPEELAHKRMANLKKEQLNDIHFGWAGATTLGQPHYYRIQGKTFLIEFDNTQSNANHIHSVWRDFDGDFGRNLIKEHYENSNHH
jgi:hypothetical protein